MKENAIIIRPLDIIKVHVDFDDENGIYDAINAERVSTIHTAKTQQISAILGIHLMGFVDREGNDINNKKACEISGYDYLGSFMLLCKTDDRFNALPFEEDELEKVYIYLTTGQIVDSYEEGIEAFFDKYDIEPILPNFGVEPTFNLFEEYPTVIYLKYDFSGEDMLKMGERLFAYADMLVNKYKEVDDVLLSPLGDHYLKVETNASQRYMEIYIQAINGSKEILIGEHAKKGKGSGKVNNFNTKRTEDTLEEIKDFDEDDKETLFPYVLIITNEAKWPNSSAYASYKVVYPIALYNEEKVNVPYFTDFIEILGVDRINDKVEVKLNFDKIHEFILEVGQEKEVEYNFYGTKSKASSLREGKMKVRLEKFNFNLHDEVKGKIEIQECFYKGRNDYRVDLIKDNQSFNKVSTECNVLFFSDTENGYYIWLIDTKKKMAIIDRLYTEDGKPDENTYFPIYLGEENVFIDSYISSEDEKRYTQEIIMKFEGGSL